MANPLHTPMDDSAGNDPIQLFRDWFSAAIESGLRLPEAVTLATASADGRPSARIVLLKGIDTGGFVFYTNYASRKAHEIRANPHAALVAHWTPIDRQVRIEGTVSALGTQESAAYFRMRPRGHQIGAWASRQSAVLDHRETLVNRFTAIKTRFGDGEITLPPFWGGFRITPMRVEFWQGHSNRLHERLVFLKKRGHWSTHFLFP